MVKPLDQGNLSKRVFKWDYGFRGLEALMAGEGTAESSHGRKKRERVSEQVSTGNSVGL